MGRCVLFDIDMTLLDSRKIHIDCFKRAFKKTFDVEGSRDEIPEHFGLTYYELIKKLCKKKNIKFEYIKLLEFIDNLAYEIENYEDGINLLPGVPEILEKLKQKNVKMIVFTGNPRVIGRVLLEKSGLINYFSDFIFSDLESTKMEELKENMYILRNFEKCYVVGDNKQDVLAAKMVGFYSIAVKTGFYKDFSDVSPDLVVDDLSTGMEKILDFILR